MLSVFVTSKLLGCSEAYIRSACDRHILGDSWSSGRKRKTYVVSPGKVAEFLGVTIEELERRVSEETGLALQER